MGGAGGEGKGIRVALPPPTLRRVHHEFTRHASSICTAYTGGVRSNSYRAVRCGAVQCGGWAGKASPTSTSNCTASVAIGSGPSTAKLSRKAARPSHAVRHYIYSRPEPTPLPHWKTETDHNKKEENTDKNQQRTAHAYSPSFNRWDTSPAPSCHLEMP